MESRVVAGCKTAVTLLCGGVGYALAKACGAGADGQGFVAGAMLGNVLQGVVSDYGKDAADWFAGRTAEALSSSSEPARNHDLDALAAQSIHRCLAIAGSRGALSASASEVARLAGVPLDVIEHTLRHPAFSEIDDVSMLGLVGAPDGGVGTVVHTPEFWARFVTALASTLPEPSGPDAVTFAAGWVHREVAAQANDILRDTFGPEGRPYVAVQHLFARHMLSALSRLEQAGQERHAETLEAHARGEAASQERHRETIARLADVLERLSPGAGAGPRPVRSNVPAVSPTFIPRPALVERIHAALAGGGQAGVIRQAAARASGGYGKTVAAILYAEAYKDFYTGGRFFLSMEGGEIATQLAPLGRYFDVPADAPPDHAAVAVRDALAGGQPALLILDNVVDQPQWQAIVSSGLVPRGACHVLVTTRAESLPQTTHVQVARLTEEEAREIYAKFCQDPPGSSDLVRSLPSPEIADAITTWLGGLAVAVAGVAALMKLKPNLGWEQYWLGDGGRIRGLRNLHLDQLPDAREDVRLELGTNGRALEEHRRTLRVLDDAFDALPLPEQRAVEYAALLPEDTVPGIWLERLLESDASRTDGTLALTLGDDADDPEPPARRVVAHLIDLDLLSPMAEDGRLLGLHRLWRQRVRERSTSDRAREMWHAIGLIAERRRDGIVGPSTSGADRGIDNPAAVTDQDLRWELSALQRTCVSLWAEGLPGPAVRFGQWLAVVLLDLGRVREALECLAPVADHEAEIEATLGDESLATSYLNLASIQKDQGNLDEARASIERALAIDQQHFAPDHPTLATSYSNLASIQQDQGDLTAARASMERALAIDQQHFAPDHPVFATRYSNLASIQRAQKDLTGARVNMERALAIEQQHFAPDHPTFAVSYSNLALIQQDQGDLAGALASIERALAIEHQHFAPDHPAFATRYSNLATIQRARGDLTEARVSMERALTIQQQHFAPDHPKFVTLYTNLAVILYEQGDSQSACSNFKKALSVALENFDESYWIVTAIRKAMRELGCPE